MILTVKLARLAIDNIKEKFVCSGLFEVQIRYTNEDTNIHAYKYKICNVCTYDEVSDVAENHVQWCRGICVIYKAKFSNKDH